MASAETTRRTGEAMTEGTAEGVDGLRINLCRDASERVSRR
jgi:hypothetical protein